MSTYLVAICVMDFSSRTSYTRRNVAVSTWAPSHLDNQTTKTLQYATNILDFYEQFYHVRYPLTKLGGFDTFEETKRNLGLKGLNAKDC